MVVAKMTRDIYGEKADGEPTMLRRLQKLSDGTSYYRINIVLHVVVVVVILSTFGRWHPGLLRVFGLCAAALVLADLVRLIRVRYLHRR
jgi:hypothetical protein